MFERVVAAIDTDEGRSREVIKVAGEIGRAFGADVLVAHVRDLERPASMLAAAGKPGVIPPPAAIRLETEEAAGELVDAAVAELRRGGVTAKGQVGPGAGSTARELLDIARAFGAGLIIVGDRDSRLTDVVLGGVAHRIVHLAGCPVLLVR